MLASQLSYVVYCERDLEEAQLERQEQVLQSVPLVPGFQV